MSSVRIPLHNIDKIYNLKEIQNPNYNHIFGDFCLYKLNNELYGYIHIPKCGSTNLKNLFFNNPDIDNVWQEQQPVDRNKVKDIKFFTMIRDEHHRQRAGYGSWQNTVHQKYLNEEIEFDYSTLPQDQVLSNRSLWDEHLEHQIYFLKPFIDKAIPFTIFNLEEKNNQLLWDKISNFIGIRL